jgi:mitochondrial fission protein ELM1
LSEQRANRPPLTIWRFADHKRGHENQALGLVEALCRLAPCKVETLTVGKGWPWLFSWLLGRFPPGKSLPKPDLIVGAGHATHWPMLAARRAHGGKIAVLMKPSLPLSWFDRVIAPEHDFAEAISPSPSSSRGRDNLLTTVGPINRIRPGQQDEHTGLMLIGGPSGEYGWNETALLKQIHLIALHQPDVTWHLTTSRRTPAGLLADLARLDLPNLHAVAHDQVGSDWLPGQLARASQVWVTPDSASMVYEALTSGAAVGCLELPYAKPGRVARGLERLVREHRVTAFADWERSGRLLPNDHPLNEAERCAKAMLQWLNGN